MSKIIKIEPVSDGVRYIYRFHLESEKVAKYFEASCLMGVREHYPLADLYAKGNVLWLDSPDKKATESIAVLLKDAIESKNVIY